MKLPLSLALAISLLGVSQAANAAATDTHSTSHRYSLPLVLAAEPGREGLVRIINRSNRASAVQFRARDDAGSPGASAGSLDLDAYAVAYLNSSDLELGDAVRGLPGVGNGQGEWRLELESDLDILALAYVRTTDGVLTAIDHPPTALENGRCYVPFFNPASNTRQVSRLRLINLGDQTAEVSIAGLDDRGAAAPNGEVRLALPAGQAHAITAQDLEVGTPPLRGGFGDGDGKWQLFVASDRPIRVMALLENPGGSLANLSGCRETLPLGGVAVDTGALGASHWGDDDYELGAASIAGDTLTTTVSYGGGCATHTFTLVVPGEFMETDPVRLRATLAHAAEDDPCEAWLTKELHFDLSPIKAMFRDAYNQEHGTVVLLLANAPDGAVTYTF